MLKIRQLQIRNSSVVLTIAVLLLGINGCFSQYPVADETKNPSVNITDISPTTTSVIETISPTPVQLPSPTPTNSPVPSATGRIAFLDTARNLYVADFECNELDEECDSQITLLANNVDDLRSPSWSQDGKKIVVAPYRFADPPGQVVIINADGSGQTTLVKQPNTIHQPVWSPTDDIIAFVNVDGYGDGDEGGIQVVQVDEGQSAILMKTSAFISELTWSLDGKHLAFEYLFVRGGYQYLYVLPVNTDRLFEQEKKSALFDSSATSYLRWGHYPTWAPDGKHIAFVCSDTGTDICLLNVETWQQINLTNNSAYDDQPVWSPDGEHIAFISDRDGNREVYRMNADGSDETRLTNTSSDELLPTWSPDSNYLAFMSNRDNIDFECRISPSFARTISYYIDSECNYEIYILKANGTRQWRLTNNAICDTYPAWAPQ